MSIFYDAIAIALRSLAISGLATLLASTWCVPIAVKLSGTRSRVGKAILGILNASIGLPTVIVGLVLYLFLSRAGPLGFLRLLYTPYAIVIGQSILVTPLLTFLMADSLSHLKDTILELAYSLGATRRQAILTLLRESLPHIISSMLVSFNRAVGELGVALMLGGNIRGLTRVMTTAIALEVEKGEFELALTLGGFLLLTTSFITLLIRALRWRK